MYVAVVRVLYLGDAVTNDDKHKGSKVEAELGNDCSSDNVDVPEFSGGLFSAELGDGR